VPEDRPEEFFGHFGRADFVGMGEIVTRGRRRAAKARKGAGLQLQGVADIIEADTMGELGIEQRHDMTPRRKSPGLLLRPGCARDLGNQELRNEVANLAQQIKF
jgi:hypothetical protein